MRHLFLAPVLGAFLLAGCEEPKKPNLADQRRSTNIEDVRPDPNVIYGDEVFVLARRGMGGQLTDRATWYFAYDAHKTCGIRFMVESGSTTQPYSEWLFKKTHRAHRARLVVFLGTSLGGLRATENAIRWGKEVPNAKARLLLVDTVPWTPAIPKYIGADHVVWRNTLASYGVALGGGKPQGTISDKQHDRPAFTTHGLLIHSAQTRKEVAAEICRGITHPSKRGKK
jgi:hypothetical protein